VRDLRRLQLGSRLRELTPLLKPVVFLLALLTAGAAWGAGLHGRVVDPDGGPLAGVTVSIPELGLTARTGADGSFALEGIPDGDYVLLAESAAVVPERMPVTVPHAGPVEIVALTVASVQDRPDKGRAGAEGEVEAGDAGGVKVQLLCTNCNAAAVSSLGLTSDHMSITLDSVPIFEGLEEIWALGMLPQEMVHETNIAPGPASVFSGAEGLAGSMDTVMVDPFDQGFHAEILRGSHDLWDSQAAGRIRITENLAADIVATYTSSDAINPNGDTRNEQGFIDRETFNARFTYRFNERSKIRFGAHLYNEDQWEAPGSYQPYSPNAPWLDETVPIDRTAFHLVWDHEFEGGGELEVVAMTSDKDQKIREGIAELPMSFHPMYDIEARYDFVSVTGGKVLGDRVLLEGGVEYLDHVMDVQDHYALNDCDKFLHDVIEGRSGFAQATFSLPARVDLLTGIRYDDFRDFGDQLSPRLGLRWKPRDGVYVNWGLGRSFRPPKPAFDEVCCGQRPQSNKEVLSESGWGTNLNVAWYPNDRVKVTFGAQYADFDDYIQHTVTGSTDLNAIYRNTNIPEATILGAEVGVRVKLDRLSFGGSVGFVDTDVSGDIYTLDENPRCSGIYEPRLVMTDDIGRLPDINEETASAFVEWTGKKWEGSLNADYYGSMYIQRLREDFPEIVYSDRLFATPSYWSVNTKITYKHRQFRFFGGVENVLDEYQDDFADPHTSAKWGLQRDRFYFAGVGVDF
jgi:outer membrane receptor protein involved in Fe transport